MRRHAPAVPGELITKNMLPEWGGVHDVVVVVNADINAEVK